MSLLKVLLNVVFGIVVLVYAKRSWDKYKADKVMVSVIRDGGSETLAYPSITICAGFKDKKVTPLALARSADEVLSLEAVRNLSFHRKEFLTFFTQALDNDFDQNLLDRDSLWSEEYHEYFGGRCFTFNPVNVSRPGETNAIAFGFKYPLRSNFWNCDQTEQDQCFKLHGIFLHPPGSFFYNKGYKFLGQSLIYPSHGQQAIYALTKQQVKLLQKDFEPCNPDFTLADWIRCIRKGFDTKAGCILPWTKQEDPHVQVCNNSQVYDRLTSIEHHTWWDIDMVAIKETGCLRPCHFEEYHLVKPKYSHTHIRYKHHGNGPFPPETRAAVQIFYVDSVRETREEYKAFDEFSLFGELGGALGLFLGVSLVEMSNDVLKMLLKS